MTDLAEIPMPPPAPGDPDRVTDRARALLMLRLRTAGATWQQIADQHGYADKSSAYRAVQRLLDAEQMEGVDQYRELSNERLDLGLRALVPIIQDAAAPAAERIRAVDSLVRLEARRARLNGLDAPVKVDLSVGVRAELLDALAELRDLVEGEVLAVTDEPAEQ